MMSVATAQQLLVHIWGYNLKIDGNFGPRTERAVRDFQSLIGLSPDGIIGRDTWDVLFPGNGRLSGRPDVS